MKKQIILIVLFLILPYLADCRNNSKNYGLIHNTVYLEGGGSAFWYSLNYERNFIFAEKHRLLFGGGLSVIPLTKDANLMLLASLGYLYGSKHKFEASLTPSYSFYKDLSEDDENLRFSLKIGYRRNWSSGLQFRVGISPIYTVFMYNPPAKKEKSILPVPYISIGYSF